MAAPDDVDVWIGLDVGKGKHFADVLDDDGDPLFGQDGFPPSPHVRKV